MNYKQLSSHVFNAEVETLVDCCNTAVPVDALDTAADVFPNDPRNRVVGIAVHIAVASPWMDVQLSMSS